MSLGGGNFNLGAEQSLLTKPDKEKMRNITGKKEEELLTVCSCYYGCLLRVACELSRNSVSFKDV